MRRDEIEKRLHRASAPVERPEREAAVLIPLLERAGETELLFEVRAAGLRHQPDEVCFPGGGLEAGESAAQCALRETKEELSLEQITLLAEFSPLRHSSGQRVYPLLGWIEQLEGLRLQTAEVAEVFTVPLTWLLANPPRMVTYTMLPDLEHAPPELLPYLPHYRRERETPLWVWQGHTIWGMTARLTQETLRRLSEQV